MSATSVLPKASSAVPSDLSLSMDPKELMGMKRQSFRQKSDVQSYTSGNKIIFNIPSGWYDGRDSFVTWVAQITTTGSGPSTYDRFSYPISSLINRARVYLGSKLVEDIDEVNVLRCIQVAAKPLEAVANNFSEGNQGTLATRAADSILAYEYNFRLADMLESLEQVIPLHKIAVPLKIELTLEADDQVLESDGTGAAYTVTEAYFHYHILQVPDSYDAAVDAKIADGSYFIPYHSWSNYSNASLTGSSAQLEIPARYKTINRFYAVMRNTTLDETDDNKFVGQCNVNGIQTQWLKVNNVFYPSDKLDVSKDVRKWIALRMFQDTSNEKFHGDFRYGDIFAASHWQTALTAAGPLYILSFDLRDDNQDYLGKEKLWGNGPDTSSSGSSMILGITLSGAPSEGQTVVSFTQYEANIWIKPGGSIEVSY